MDRRSWIESLLDASGKGLEIGASHTPFFPKSAGYDVEVADHLDADGLRAKYGALGDDVSRVEDVDYVMDGGPITDFVKHESYYDFVFSSHVIEHVTDFIGYMQSCETLLKPGGRAVLAVPDRRYCFDAFQRSTTTGAVIDAHLAGRRRHTAGEIHDFFSNYAVLDGNPSWTDGASGRPTVTGSVAWARSQAATAEQTGDYLDVHCWFFTPASMRLIMQDLHELGYTRLKETSIVNIGSHEFYIGFALDGGGSGLTRQELLLDIAREELKGIQVLLGQRQS